VTHVLNTACLQ